MRRPRALIPGALLTSLFALSLLAGCEAEFLRTSLVSPSSTFTNTSVFLPETTLAEQLMPQPQVLWQAEENENQNGLLKPKNSLKSVRAHTFMTSNLSTTQQKNTVHSRHSGTPPATPPATPPGRWQAPIKLVFFGDVMLGRYVRELMEQNGHDYPFEKMDESYLKENDLLVINLEGPVTERAVRTSTGMSFGFFPDTVELLKKHHIDVVSQANNHTLDKQQKGYEESMTLLRNGGLTALGHQKNINNDTAALLEINGKKIALVGLEDVMSPIDSAKATQLIANLSTQKYRVIVYPHWGAEYQNLPNSRQKELAHAFIDAGAYAVIGHHPHVPQAYENYNGRPIFYSLGNAIFDQYWSKPTQEGLSLVLEIGQPADWLNTGRSPNNSSQPAGHPPVGGVAIEQLTITLVPISINRSQMALMEGTQKESFLKTFATFGEHTENEQKQLEYGTLTLTVPF